MATVFLILYVTSVLTAIGVGLYAAACDVRRMQIPNICPVVVIGAFVGAYAACALGDVGALENWRAHMIAAGIMLVVTVLIYAARALGAGDSKLLAAYALWVGLKGLVPFITFMALAGGILAIAALFMKGRTIFPNPREGSWIAVVQGGKGALPYGVAIFAGACVAFFELGFLAPDTLRAFLSPQS